MRWQVSVQHELRWVDEDHRWPTLAALVRMETNRYAGDTSQVQPVRYYLSSHPCLTAAQAFEAVRGHWVMENQLH